ncbi:MAG: 6-phosphogluconolactonase [Chlamydiae bacterium]|nr:6-phosphogluconolactonase [Chlamydiota bacterium]
MLTFHFDDRRDITIPGDVNETLSFCIDHLLNAYHTAVKSHGAFYIALSGGSTPKAIFEKLTSSPIKEQIDWTKVHLFWGDERSVGPENPESNYHMAMEAGFKNMGIPSGQIHRMVAEENIDNNAEIYSQTLQKVLKGKALDYTMLGMGEDGHTASLFPHTEALSEEDLLAVANHVPQKNTWRMTLTYPCINNSIHIVIYVIGSSKKQMLQTVFKKDAHFIDLPIVKIGSKTHKALWICDTAAAELLKK